MSESVESGKRELIKRAIILFVNFFLIILAYYHIKPASRSLFIEHIGADYLPYVWIATAVVLGTLIGFYHKLVERHSRLNVVLSSCLISAGLLIFFRLWLLESSAAAAVIFYIFVDIFSVVLVEQFWSLTNVIYNTDDGKRWYGFVGAGGLVGGAVGGFFAARLLDLTPMTTEDLLIVAAGILVLIFALNYIMGRMGIYAEEQDKNEPVINRQGWRALFTSRYLILIAAILLFAQLCQPLVEFQFIKMIEASFPEKDERTGFISQFFAVMGVISILINLILTPIIHRFLGVISGLVIQPMMLSIFSLGFMLFPTLYVCSAMKISDRGINYSINRASKELLYIPIDPVHTYQAKAWIDMFGYRLFKVLGSVMILTMTQWTNFNIDITQIGWVTIAVCILWMFTLTFLKREYKKYEQPIKVDS